MERTEPGETARLAGSGAGRALAAGQPVGEEGERDALMLAGGVVVAAIALALVIFIAYKTFYAHTVSTNSGIFFLGLAFFPYTGGVYMFCYAWKRGDVAAALRLTLVVALASAAALALFAVVLALLSRSKDAAAAATNGERGGDFLGRGVSDVFDGGVGLPADILMGTFGVARQRPAEEPAALRVVCERCGGVYTPAPPRAACPSCGWEALGAAANPTARAG